MHPAVTPPQVLFVIPSRKKGKESITISIIRLTLIPMPDLLSFYGDKFLFRRGSLHGRWATSEAMRATTLSSQK